MSTTNQGTALQNLIQTIARTYQNRGVLKLHKVDPPMRVVGGGAARKVIFMENPFLDFVGAWTARGGRAIALEAKSTKKPTLGIQQSGGISENQFAALRRWRDAGAVVGVLWEHAGEMRFVPFPAMESQIAQNVWHIKWKNATPIPRGAGFCVWDFVKVLEEYFPNTSVGTA